MKWLLKKCTVILPFVSSFLPGCKNTDQGEIVPSYLYKVSSPQLWQASQHADQLLLTDMDKAFIHLARQDQLDDVINKFWKSSNQPYVILKLATRQLQGELRFEANKPGGNKYYHLYNGYIPITAIESVITES